jgi:serine phosphatase RsbU (regulator of sigma subunit)
VGLVGTVVTVVLALTGRPAWTGLSVGLVMIGAAVLGTALGRDRTGVIGSMGGAAAADAMLVDLRNRVRIQSAVPALPAGWQFDTDLRSAHGDSFSGDFVVTAAPDPNRIEVALVDVSGKGHVAGGRALLLAGAFEALLDAVPRDRFLPAANQHVLRHGDEEGFATAVQVSLDLRTGAFLLSGAGHPPAAHYRAGSGRWTVMDGDQGPALGLLPDAGYPSLSGVLAHGDALLLFTDGLVESRRLDVGRGIDRLTGHADAVLARGGDAVAARIAEAIRAEQGDDRALVVIRRT